MGWFHKGHQGYKFPLVAPSICDEILAEPASLFVLWICTRIQKFEMSLVRSCILLLDET